jgi:hypothetical protein
LIKTRRKAGPPADRVPPMPYSDVCPVCKIQHTRNAFAWRETPAGRIYGHYCSEACEGRPLGLFG